MPVALEIKPKSKLHNRIMEEVQRRVYLARQRYMALHNEWRDAEKKYMAYLPEREIDAKRRVKRESGLPQYTTIVLPYSYAMLLTAHTYWASVFLGRTPIFQYSARHGQPQMAVQAVEALIDYQMQVGGNVVPLYQWLLDVGKYGVGVLGVYWDEQYTTVTRVVEESGPLAQFLPEKMRRKRVTERVKGYEGNHLYNIRPYDFFPDPRVPFHRFQEGEFVVVYTEVGWHQIRRRGRDGLYFNLKELADKKHQTTLQRVQSAELREEPTIATLPTVDPSAVAFFEVYIELVPSEWGLSDSDEPEKWVFTITTDYELVVGAQPLGLYHGKFPFAILEYEPGYALANRGMMKVLEPVQHTIDWLLNSHFYNVRAALNNTLIVDPSRVVIRDLLEGGPGGIIRAKPSAYGQPVRDYVEQLQVIDITRSHLTDLQLMFEIGYRMVGLNDALMGLAKSSGRRTATEVRTSSTFGINRMKTIAEYFSALGFAPLAQMLLQHTQQFYSAEQTFKIAGDLTSDMGSRYMTVTPEMIEGFYDFVPVDGTMPIDRFAQANLWKELMLQLRQFPPLLAQYDIGRIFAWVARLAGLKNIEQFRVQVAPEEALAAQAAAGSVVPMPTGGTNVNEPRQVAGVGPTG